MGLLGFDLQEGIDATKSQFLGPFNRFNNRKNLKAELIDAHNRQDFAEFTIRPTRNQAGRPAEPNSTVALRGDALPHQPFVYGGQQKLVKDYYPGNSEPTVQVLGPRENNVTIKGRFKSKKFKFGDKTQRENFRQYALEMQQLVEYIRVNGFLCELKLGEWVRWGFIEEAVFDFKTMADIDYSISFSITGFNPPKDFIVVKSTAEIPFQINRQLINQLSKLQGFRPPATIKRGFADQINDAIGEIAEAVNLVTGFVDNVLGTVDSLKGSVARAKGLIKNAQVKCSQYQRRIGASSPEGDFAKSAGFGVSGAYQNARYLHQNQQAVFSITALLAALSVQINKITATVPLARHRVRASDSLQSLAMKYYKDANKWPQIFDHNKLQTTDLVVGSILEIPRA